MREGFRGGQTHFGGERAGNDWGSGLICFNMFKDELKRKLKVGQELLPFALTMLARDKLAVSGVKNVMLSTGEEVRLKIAGGALSVAGEGLRILEIGGSDIYVKGDIRRLEFVDGQKKD